VGKVDRHNDYKICRMPSVNEAPLETPVKSICLSVACLELRIDRMLKSPCISNYLDYKTPYAGDNGILLHR
jgi:hypothetical protein